MTPEHNQRREIWFCKPEDALGAGKVLDLLTHDVDAALVGRVELKRHRARRGAVQRARQRQNRGRLACAGGAVEQQVRQPVLLREARDCVCGSERGTRQAPQATHWCPQSLCAPQRRPACAAGTSQPVRGCVSTRCSALLRAVRTQGWFSGALALLLLSGGGSDMTASIWTRGRLEERAWLSAAVPA